MAKKAKKAKKTAKATKKVAKKTKKMKKQARGFPQAKAAAVSRPPSLVSLTHRKMSLAETRRRSDRPHVHTAQEAYDRCTWVRFFVSGRWSGHPSHRCQAIPRLAT